MPALTVVRVGAHLVEVREGRAATARVDLDVRLVPTVAQDVDDGVDVRAARARTAPRPVLDRTPSNRSDWNAAPRIVRFAPAPSAAS